MRLTHDQRGFSTHEVMISIFISALLGLLVTSVFIAALRFFNITRNDVDIQTEVSRIITLFQQDVRSAEAVSEYPLGTPTYVSDEQTLVVRALSLEADGDIMPTTYDYFVYSVSGSGPYTLTREVIANGAGRSSSTDILSSHITNLRFTYNTTPVTDASEIIIETAITKEYQSLRRTLTSRAAVKLRN